MSALILTLSLAASAVAVKYTCGAWGPVNATDGYTFSGGAVEVYDSVNGTYFTLTNGELKKNNVTITNSVVAHVHAKACNDMAAGGHFLKNTSITDAILENELWASPGADSRPAKQSGAWTGSGSLPGFQITGRDDVKAIIVHEYADDVANPPSPKRVCCDLAVDTSTAPATTTVEGSSVAGSTATGTGTGSDSIASTATAVKCEDDACCKKYEEDDQPCTACLSVEGCSFFSVLNTNAATAGAICKSNQNATMTPVTHKKVEGKDKCADLCKDLECTQCIGDGASKTGVVGCVWCDSGKAAGDKLGTNLLSTGSCELAKCITEASKQAKCSSAASLLMSAVVATVAAVAMF